MVRLMALEKDMTRLETAGMPMEIRTKIQTTALRQTFLPRLRRWGTACCVPLSRKSNRFAPSALSWMNKASTMSSIRHRDSTPAISNRAGDVQMAE